MNVRPPTFVTIGHGPLAQHLRVSSLGVALVLSAVAAVRFASTPAAPAFIVFVVAMAMVSDLDAHHRAIPVALLGALGLCGTTAFVGTAIAVDDGDPLIRAFVAAAASWALFRGARAAYPNGLTRQDTRIVPFLGLYLGWLGTDVALIGLGAGIATSGVYAAVAIIRRHPRPGPAAVPLTPFLAAASVVTVLLAAPGPHMPG